MGIATVYRVGPLRQGECTGSLTVNFPRMLVCIRGNAKIAFGSTPTAAASATKSPPRVTIERRVVQLHSGEYEWSEAPFAGPIRNLLGSSSKPVEFLMIRFLR